MGKSLKRMFADLKKERLHSTSNVLIMAITFLVLGVFITVVAMTQTALRFLENQAQVTVFFKDEFEEPGILQLKDRLSADERISEVSYISKNDAFKIFTEVNKNEEALLESISADILPASLEIKTKNIADLSTLSEEFSSLEGVEDVRFFKDVIEKFRVWSGIAYIAGFVLAGIFMTISYSVVISTLRSAIRSKAGEIEIMKLVGASENYVRTPFVQQGLFFGLVSSAIAGIFFVVFLSAGYYAEFLSWNLSFGFIHGFSITPVVFSLGLAFVLVLSGGLLGYLGSSVAIKKYLEY